MHKKQYDTWNLFYMWSGSIEYQIRNYDVFLYIERNDNIIFLLNSNKVSSDSDLISYRLFNQTYIM